MGRRASVVGAATAAVVIAVVAAAAIGVAPAVAASEGRPPAYPRDLGDPYVLAVSGTYWAYGTGTGARNLQVVSSNDLVHWSAVRDPLPTLPRWASSGRTWAPGVVQRGRQFVMYYSALDRAAGKECISDATSSSPAGPFVDLSVHPLVCQLAGGGSIDPSPFTDTSGGLYLLWKSDDNALGRPAHLWAQALTRDGRVLVGSPADILTESRPWQAPTIEGPAMVQQGDVYYLFYGANNWNSVQSGIGYAVCMAVLGPCVNASISSPWLGSQGDVRGPQGPTVFKAADGTTKLAYAAWPGQIGYVAGGVRSLWIRTLSFGLGGPELAG